MDYFERIRSGFIRQLLLCVHDFMGRSHEKAESALQLGFNIRKIKDDLMLKKISFGVQLVEVRTPC